MVQVQEQQFQRLGLTSLIIPPVEAVAELGESVEVEGICEVEVGTVDVAGLDAEGLEVIGVVDTGLEVFEGG